MRKAAVFLACFLAVIHVDVARSQPVLTDVREFQSTVLGDKEFRSASEAIRDASIQMTVIGADDLAVGASLLSIASSLKTLFSANDSEQAAVLRQIGLLRQQQGEMLRLLAKIVDILAELDVAIADAVREEFISLLRNEVNSAITNHYETRATLVANPSYRDAKEQFELVWRRLQERARTLMGYGPAVFQTVGATMLFESDSAQRINRDRFEQIEKLKTYKNYFDDVLDPKKPGSVGASFAYLKALVAKADAILAAADAALGQSRSFDRGEWCTPWEACQDRGGSTRDCYRRTTVINGNRTASYSVSTTDQHVRSEGRCYGRPGGPREPRGLRSVDTLLSIARVAPPVLPSPGGDSPEERVDFWNRTKAVLEEAKKQLPAIEQNHKAATLYLEEVVRRIKQLGG